MDIDDQVVPSSLEWLIRRKPATLLMLLKQDKEQHISELSDKSKMSYVHTIKILGIVEREGIVQTETKGNRRIVVLTDCGKRFVAALEMLISSLSLEKEGLDVSKNTQD
ncbi:MAG: hypothetical protein ABIG39_06585 [Candidatus Micrarchaeota archaeon]